MKTMFASGLVVLLQACASSYTLPNDTKTGSINQEVYAKMRGPSALNGVMVGPTGFPLYASFSIFRGDKPWKGDPTKEIAHHKAGNVEIVIKADRASEESADVAARFAADFTRTFSALDARIWKKAHERYFDIEMLMFMPGTRINRQYRRLMLSNTFHLQFYFPFYQSDKSRDFGQMYGDAQTLAHELYHLRVRRLGASKAKPFRKDLDKLQRHVLEEAGGKFIGACVELKMKKVIGIGSGVMHYKRDPFTGQNRFGTLSDKMILAALKPGAKIPPADLVSLGPMLFATFWAEQAGATPLIHEGEGAAKAIEDICENHIAHPTDLWPVFWKMASDGKDAPVFVREQKPKVGS
ncbi:MAG: hypothetical protein COA84_05110 [Robiginitomaculum sp.]|nr:MAG: hypothetical protein COA84_05110 [Robiginitomaculum sp.]